MSFRNFSIDPRCLNILDAQNIVTPTPIQAQAVPVALEGRDLVAIAQTGTGKTLGFTLPSITRLANDLPGKTMLVLTPTRELALQVHAIAHPLGKALGLRSCCVYGGAGLAEQTRNLRQNPQIIVATPGRLLDHIGRKNIRFDKLAILVLDEADRMLDMGFLPDIRRILDKLPKERQTLMFSATFPKEIARLAADMQREPVRVEVGPVARPVDAVAQGVYTVDQSSKIRLLTQLLKDSEVKSALVFIQTKHRTDRVTRTLHKEGFKVQAIHGDRSQSQRQQALEGFRQGRYRILVATDIAARGIDIQGISHVINYDIPKTSEDYIHRIGRTARANTTGDAITFVSPDEFMALSKIEASLGKNIERREWEGSVPVISLFTPPEERAAAAKAAGARRRPRSLLRRR